MPFFDEVKEARPPGRLRSNFNDVVLRGLPRISSAYRDAQNIFQSALR